MKPFFFPASILSYFNLCKNLSLKQNFDVLIIWKYGLKYCTQSHTLFSHLVLLQRSSTDHGSYCFICSLCRVSWASFDETATGEGIKPMWDARPRKNMIQLPFIRMPTSAAVNLVAGRKSRSVCISLRFSFDLWHKISLCKIDTKSSLVF